MTQIQNNDDLLSYIVAQSNTNQKNWWGFPQQRITGIFLAHQIAIAHADTLTPDEAVDYAINLNNAIYTKIIKG